MTLAPTFVPTPSGATIAVYEAGEGPRHLFMIGGLAGRPVTETPVAKAIAEAAARGMRVTWMDIAGCGASTRDRMLTMDGWLADVEHVFGERVGVPALWFGASIGAWLMLWAQARNPAWFRSMCAFAPAIDWDQQYVKPALLEERLGFADGCVTTAEGTPLLPRETILSMAPYHLLQGELRLAAPLHVVYSGRDEMVPAEATRRFFARATGARCSAMFYPEGDHGIAKLDPAPVRMHFLQWLAGQERAL
jgi:alpha-beta hydrolase superfamily lysophospholipase